MTDKEMAEEYCNEKCKDCYMCSYSEHKNPYKVCQRRKDRKQAYLAGLKAGKDMNAPTKWHDLRKDRQDLPTGKVNLDMYPDFMKSKVKPRIKVVAKICFKGYEKPTPWEDILYYEDGKWLELHHLQGKCIFFKEIPKCEYVLAWCEIPEYTEE